MSPGWLMRWPLIGLILLYRRWLSGRGPLRRVRCSFHGSESCSTYGLRRAREARSPWAAVGDIRRRLRRCRQVSLYRRGAALAWGELHDRDPDAIDGELAAAGENAASRAMALRARAAVADYHGDRALAAACRERASALSPARSQLLIRGPGGTDARVRNLLAAGEFARPR